MISINNIDSTKETLTRLLVSGVTFEEAYYDNTEPLALELTVKF